VEVIVTQYVIRRLLQAVIVVFGVTIAAFSINFLAGDPTYVLIGDMRGMTQDDIQAFRERMGFDRPVHVQYLDWLGKAVQGDFGTSMKFKENNWKVIAERFPATLQLAAAALAVGLIVAIPLGIVAAVNRGSIWDRISMVIALVGQSTPSFWMGLMLMLIFSVWLGLLPVSGRYEGVRSMILPVMTLSFYDIARNTRIIRGSLLEILGEDYIRTARAKGAKPRLVLVGHALRNALIPVVTLIGMDLGSLLGGAIIVETIFAWPGMGILTINAINGKDLSLLQACVTLFALTFVFANLLVDFAYTFLDPRVRLK
jgi:peptide/nickel transport system permease protein